MPNGSPRLRVKFNNQANNQYQMSFGLANVHASESLDPRRLRIIFLNFFPEDPDNMTPILQTGYEDVPGFTNPGGGLGLFTDFLSYNTSLHPEYLDEEFHFNSQIRARFNANTFLPGRGIQNCQMSIIRSNYKQWPTTNGNTNTGDYLYKHQWATQGIGTSYVAAPYVILEQNDDADYTDPDSLNWYKVDSYSASGVPDVQQAEYPYLSDVNGSIHFDTYSDHRRVLLDQACKVDSRNPNTSYPSPNPFQVYNRFWDGGGNSTRRSLLDFNIASVLPPGSNLDKVHVVVLANGSNISASMDLKLHIMDAPWDEATATWNNTNGNQGAIIGSWRTYANGNDQQNGYAIFEIPNPPQGATDGVMIKSASEQTSDQRFEFYGEAAPTEDEPYIAIRFSGSGPTPTKEGSGVADLPSIEVSGSGNSFSESDGSGVAVLPPIEVSGSGNSFAINEGSGVALIPSIEVQGSGLSFSIISGSGNINIPRVAVNGIGDFMGIRDGDGSILLRPMSIQGVGTINLKPIVVFITAYEGRWDEVIQIRILNLPANFKITLDGYSVNVVSVVGDLVTWIVPRIPIGLRQLLVEEV
jgi:hypothetical protein